MEKPKCERCAKYGNSNSEMQKRELEPLEVKNKMRIGKITGYPYFVVYLGYEYFECPICHWFKFIKKSHIKTVKIDGYDTE